MVKIESKKRHTGAPDQIVLRDAGWKNWLKIALKRISLSGSFLSVRPSVSPLSVFVNLSLSFAVPFRCYFQILCLKV